VKYKYTRTRVKDNKRCSYFGINSSREEPILPAWLTYDCKKDLLEVLKNQSEILKPGAIKDVFVSRSELSTLGQKNEK